MQKLESYPELEFQTADPRYKSIVYKDSDTALYKWLHGQTGFPMIDATMRCLARTGFVNFRMRAMAISFAAFGLHLSWKKVMYPFARLMADYEPGIHIYQVQMQSGVTKGTAMRVYNPVKQMLDKDEECLFIKKWVPELQPFSPSQIYEYINTSEKFGIRQNESLGAYTPPITHWTKRSYEMKEQLMISRNVRKKNNSQQLQLNMLV